MTAVIDQVQAAIDAHAYPPTMRFQVAGLRPLGCLLERARKILKLCPDFFTYGGTFLDVGANKGFFSLRAALEGRGSVLAIDPDADVLAAWAPVAPPNLEQRACSFGQLDTANRFDTIWVGNGPHYLYREDQGYLERLLGLAADRLIMEGPVGRRCRDVRDWGHVQEEEDMLARLTRGFRAPFRLLGRTESPTYTPARAIWYLRRVPGR